MWILKAGLENVFESVYQYYVVDFWFGRSNRLQTLPQCTPHPFCCVTCLLPSNEQLEVLGMTEVFPGQYFCHIISGCDDEPKFWRELSKLKLLELHPSFSHFTSRVPVTLWPITLFASICWLCTVTTSRLFVIIILRLFFFLSLLFCDVAVLSLCFYVLSFF